MQLTEYILVMKRLKFYMNLITSWIKRKRFVLLVSLFNVFILTILTYILNNQPVFTGEDLNHFAWMQILKNKLGIEEETIKNDVLFVNVANDKQLTDLYDEYGMSIGNTDITDRNKLLKILKMLHSTKKYAYIFLDIRFEKGYYVPETDSLLYAEIKNMENIVIANHSDMVIADSTLLSKAAISDYKSTIVTTNFVRYKFSYEGIPSMPLYAYREITKHNINKHYFIYTCNGKVCYNSLFVDFPVEDFNEYDSNNKKIYYNLGSDLLENYTEQDIATLTNNKYVVIGDMVEDLHDTYSGLKPGSVITFYAFRSLMEGKHFVNLWIILLMAIVYFTISIVQFCHQSIFEKIPFVHKSNSKLLHFTLSLVEYTLLLILVVGILDLIWGISTSILLPSIYFAIQKTIINYKRTIV